MSEENKDLEKNSENDLDLETKIKHDKVINADNYDNNDPADNQDMLALEKKKNQLLDEKKKEQARNRELEQELSDLRTMFKQQETEKLEKNQEYKTLYENTLQEKTQVEQELYNMQNSLVSEKKKKAFNKELGCSLNKDRYYDFVDLNSILIDGDGMVNKDSVKYSVNLFRTNYPELVPKQNFPKVGSQSASNQGISNRVKTETMADRSNAKRAFLLKK